MPRLNVSEGFQRSNNPPQVFSTKLNQENFTPQDFAIDRLNQPNAIDDLATNFTATWPLFDGGQSLTVIAAILPMAFVVGLTGPYMRPIPVGASAAMVFSLIVAFIVTPWASLRLLRPAPAAPGHGDAHASEDRATRFYRRVMGPLLHRTGWRVGFLASVAVLLLAACGLVAVGLVHGR